MKVYELVDRHPAQAKRVKVDCSPGYLTIVDKTIKAIFSGERRKPKAGEWFLSGNPIEAYQTKNDLDTEYYIAKIVRVKKVETFVIEPV